MLCAKLFLLVFIVYFVSTSEALNAGDEGVCVIKQSFQETKRVTYSVRTRKYCGKPKCFLQKARIVNQVTWKNQTICCYGWQHDSERDMCVPVCSTGCINGTCIAPDVCRCEPPLRLDPLRHNSCIDPKCDPPCSGAQCSGDVCECLPHHQRFNDSHCVRCDEGFTVNSELKCIPKCDQQCVNSTCVATNTCKCLEGYRNKDAYTCEPVCNCVNAACVGPHTCACLPGFSAVNATVCARFCEDCDTGECTDTCVCRDGFEKIAGVCKPVCHEACVNGVCTAPDVCECNEGYTKNASQPAVCSKACAAPCGGFCDADGVCLKKRTMYFVM